MVAWWRVALRRDLVSHPLAPAQELRGTVPNRPLRPLGCLSITSSWGFAARRTSASAVCAVQQLIGAAVMNNTFGLGIFMGLIYFQDLYWK